MKTFIIYAAIMQETVKANVLLHTINKKVLIDIIVSEIKINLQNYKFDSSQLSEKISKVKLEKEFIYNTTYQSEIKSLNARSAKLVNIMSALGNE